MINSRLKQSFALALITGLLQGCVPAIWGYGPDGQTREEFEQRVEAAFKLQNQMTSEVMEIQSDKSDAKYHIPIIQAEQEMEKTCTHLNEYVSREIDGLNKSLFLLKRVENSVIDCEASAHKVETLLKTHQ